MARQGRAGPALAIAAIGCFIAGTLSIVGPMLFAVPLMTLGIPGSFTTAIMLGALSMLGVQPGPLMYQKYPDVFWSLIASMDAGNAILALVLSDGSFWVLPQRPISMALRILPLICLVSPSLIATFRTLQGEPQMELPQAAPERCQWIC